MIDAFNIESNKVKIGRQDIYFIEVLRRNSRSFERRTCFEDGVDDICSWSSDNFHLQTYESLVSIRMFRTLHCLSSYGSRLEEGSIILSSPYPKKLTEREKEEEVEDPKKKQKENKRRIPECDGHEPDIDVS